MNGREDRLIDWDRIDEQTIPIDEEIAKTTQNILIISENISRLNDEELSKNIPRRDELIEALNRVLDNEYLILDRQNRVKAMKELNLRTYHKPTRRKKIPARPVNVYGFGEVLKQLIDEQEKRRDEDGNR